MSCANVLQSAQQWVNAGVEQCVKENIQGYFVDSSIELLHDRGNVFVPIGRETTQDRLHAGHQDCRADAGSRDIPDRSHQRLLADRDEIEEISTYIPRQLTLSVIVEALYARQPARIETALHVMGSREVQTNSM